MGLTSTNRESCVAFPDCGYFSRLLVPMHHPATMRLVLRQRSLLQPLRRRLYLHALPHQVVHAVLTTNIVQNTNVGVIQSGDRLRSDTAQFLCLKQEP
jgi:hypothetical protein